MAETLTANDIKFFVKKIVQDHGYVGIHKFAEDSRYQWAVVFGWCNEGNDQGILIKTAYCSKNCGLTADYDMWNCPRYKNSGEDDDTETFYEYGENMLDNILETLGCWNADISRFMDEYVGKYSEEDD